MILVNKSIHEGAAKAVLAMQRRPVKQIKETVAVAENSNESPTNEHLTNAALQLIKEAQSIPPMKYLEAIKSEKGGYVSKQETWLLQDLVSQSGLSSSVINVLLNYVLVIKNNASLNASYVNTVANEWAQKKIRHSRRSDSAYSANKQSSKTIKTKKDKQIIQTASEMFGGKSFLIGSTSQKMKNRSVVRKKQRLTAVLKNTWRKRRVTSNGRRRQRIEEDHQQT